VSTKRREICIIALVWREYLSAGEAHDFKEKAMSDRHGIPIWYELMTKDPLAARLFYNAVIGWEIDESVPAGSSMDYRMISAKDGLVGGVFKLTDDMCKNGAAPCWMMYIGVDDVDAIVAAVTAAGGSVQMPAFDIPNVGRIAMISDPQGAPLYVMRGASDEVSTACDPDLAGHGAWHELHTSDGQNATDFYCAQFAWRKSRQVDMGAMGTYQLLDIGGHDLGGTMTDSHFPRPAWLVYFRVDGIESAAQRIVAAGGKVINGPMEVLGGGWILNGLDPEGAMFALTGTK
jgi:predicted enzyme related to lactoylglutathione lyase